MLVVPAAWAVTRPVALTDRIAGSSEFHVTAPALLIVFPDAFTAVAANWDVWPGRSVPSWVVIWTAATAVLETGSLPPQATLINISITTPGMVRITVAP